MSPPTAVDVSVHGETDTTAIVLPDPLTVNGVSKRRLLAGPLSGGVAAKTSSDLFKGPTFAQGKPKARRWDHYINEESASRKPSSLKGAAKYLKNPGLISLGGGLPSSEYFPFEHIEVKVPVPGKFSEQETRESGQTLHIGKHDVREGHGIYDLSIALNYGQATGSAQLLRFVTEHTEIVHSPPYADWGCCLTVGATSALDIAFRMFLRRGDCVLSEEYTFCSAVETAAPMGVKVVGVKMDGEGLLPGDMDRILSTWDPAARGGARKPFLLYTVPTGQNPTGATQGLERRRALLAVAQKHDLLIIEDEPYYFLQMPPYHPNTPPPVPPTDPTTFLATLVPSLLNLDPTGRVLRLDSFSKTLAPGTRAGWLTAPQQIVDRFVRHQEVSVQNPCGFAQVLVWKLLDVGWGHGGWLGWLARLGGEYARRRGVVLGACERFLPRQVVRWRVPAAGMFLWIQILYRLHPAHLPHAEIEHAIFEASIAHNVLLTPGSWFRAEQDADGEQEGKQEQEDGREMFFRATFAAAGEAEMVEGIRRFGGAVRGVFGLPEEEDVEEGVGNGVEGEMVGNGVGEKKGECGNGVEEEKVSGNGVEGGKEGGNGVEEEGEEKVSVNGVET